MSADRKQQWAARLARRHTRNKAPAPKAKTPREKRSPRVLEAVPSLAADIQLALCGEPRRGRP